VILLKQVKVKAKPAPEYMVLAPVAIVGFSMPRLKPPGQGGRDQDVGEDWPGSRHPHHRWEVNTLSAMRRPIRIRLGPGSPPHCPQCTTFALTVTRGSRIPFGCRGGRCQPLPCRGPCRAVQTFVTNPSPSNRLHSRLRPRRSLRREGSWCPKTLTGRSGSPISIQQLMTSPKRLRHTEPSAWCSRRIPSTTDLRHLLSYATQWHPLEDRAIPI
jgi:hypothetical protein